MAEYPKKVKLKDGTVVSLRLLEKKDQKALAAFFRGLPDEDRHFLKDNVTSPAVIERWIKNLDYNAVLPVIAEYKGKIIGDATLHKSKYGWFKHIGEIRCVVARDFQRRGLGKLLIRETYAKAQEDKLSKLEIQILPEHKGIMAIFQKLGFVQEAVLKDHALDINGQKHDLIIMTSNLEDLWKKMEDMLWKYDVGYLSGKE
jgi:RimJ/RimL family protein N-acetyltransferase